MSKKENESKRTSRRQFTKTMVTAAVAVPVATTLLACKGISQDGTVATARPSPTPAGGPQIISCDPAASFEEHIPPMGFDGGGSLRIELKNKFELPTAQPPHYVYVERNNLQNNQRYGQLEKVRVISELTVTQEGQPHITDVIYANFPNDAQLLIWYEKIRGQNETGEDDPDADFDPPQGGYPANNPDFRIIGGRGANHMRLTVKHKTLMATFEKTHKKGRPFRIKHESDASIPGLGRHFRIGQWRIVGHDGETAVEDANHNKFEGQGAEDYRIYAFFGHFA